MCETDSEHYLPVQYYFFHRKFSLVFHRLLCSASADLPPAANLVLTQAFRTSAGSVNLLILSSLPSFSMSQKSLRRPFDGACCAVGVSGLREATNSKCSADPESVLNIFLEEEALGRHFFSDAEDCVCCALFDFGLSKSSRMEVSPIRSVRKDWWLEGGAACSAGEGAWGFSLRPWKFSLVLEDSFGSCSNPCPAGLDNVADQPRVTSEEEGLSLSAQSRKAAASPDPRPLLLAGS